MLVAPASTADLLALICNSGIASVERLAAAGPLPSDPREAVRLLIQKGPITRFQAQQLLQGRDKGFLLGQHLILDHLGRGGMGSVYLAEHRELRRKVAIKVLVVGKADDRKLAFERFSREARAAAALDHPNIVRIFDVSRHKDVPYLVMEYVDGKTLQQTLDRTGPLPYRDAVDAVAQAAAGLQHAHEKGFVHRDIKPGNLIRDRAGTVKILDMGLARASANQDDRLTERLDEGAVVGTADFIAPEQALNAPQVDGRADIYSLGATFFALVAGRPPFEGNTTQKLLQHQIKAAPLLSQLNASLPDGLVAVAAKMLAKKPADRYQTAADVVAALSPWLGNDARSAPALSRTSLDVGGESAAPAAAAASGRALRSAKATIREHDSAVVNPSEAVETVDMAASRTARAPMRPRPAIATDDGKRVSKSILPAAVGVAVVLAACIGALKFGWNSFTSHPVASRDTSQATAPTPTPNDSEMGKSGPAGVDPMQLPSLPIAGESIRVGASAGLFGNPPPTRSEKILSRLDLSREKPFAIRSGLEANRGGGHSYKLLSRTGPGDPPAGWRARCWNADSQIEFAGEMAGTPTLVLRNVRPPASAMLFMPHFDCATGVCRLNLEYSAPVADRRFTIRFKPADDRSAWDVVQPPPTLVGSWRVEDDVIDLKGASGGFFEFHNVDPSPAAVLRIRAVSVSEVPRGTSPTVPPMAAPPAFISNDIDSWKEQAKLYHLDIAEIEPFQVSKEGGKVIAGDAKKLPDSVGCYCWKGPAIGEFRCERVDGSPALGMTNLSNEMSAQFAFEFERDSKTNLVPGKCYRIRIEYAARNEAVGRLVVQSLDFKNLHTTNLPATDGAWKMAAVSFERQEGTPIRFTIDNDSVGEGNAIYFRSVEVFEIQK